MLPHGKTIFLWQPENCGSVSAIVTKALELGLTAVNIKVANGTLLYTGLTPLVTALRQAGIKVGGWHYVYGGVYWDKETQMFRLTGKQPYHEAQVSRQAIEMYDLDYFEIDAEREWKVNLPGLSDKASRAREYVSVLAPNTLTCPVGLSTYRFPSLHKDFPFMAFMTSPISYVAPQVYWQTPNGVDRGPAMETVISHGEYKGLMDAYGVQLLFAPAGRCYIGDGYPNPGPDYAETKTFMQTAVLLGSWNVSFWALDYLFLDTHAANQAERKRAIADFNWPNVTPPIPPEPPEPPDEIKWYQVDTTASYIYLRPQPESGSALSYSGVIYDNKPVIKFGEVVNEKGETWAIVGGYVLDKLIKPKP